MGSPTGHIFRVFNEGTDMAAKQTNEKTAEKKKAAGKWIIKHKGDKEYTYTTAAKIKSSNATLPHAVTLICRIRFL